MHQYSSSRDTFTAVVYDFLSTSVHFLIMKSPEFGFRKALWPLAAELNSVQM